MYNIYKKSDIYLKYNFSENKLTLIGNRNDFLKEIHSMFKEYCRHDGDISITDFQSTGNNPFHYYLKEIVPTDNPATADADYGSNDFLYLDGYYSTVDPINYIEEAFNCFGKKRTYTTKHSQYKKSSQYNHGFCSVQVSHKGNKREEIHHMKKCHGIKRIYEMASDTEYGKYVRNKAIPFNGDIRHGNYGEEPIRRHESWKNKKKRKQWM